MPKLQIIIASIREGRVGLPVGNWFHAFAQRHQKFDIELVDLAEVNLPLFNEPKHPMMKQYKYPHTKAWSERIERGDAYVIVTPEYNHSPPPSLTNALDYLSQEWSYKPVAFVSYGGIAGGTRSVQNIKHTVLALKMVPIYETVAIPFVAQQINKESGAFDATPSQEKAAGAMLDEVLRWAEALQPLRKSA